MNFNLIILMVRTQWRDRIMTSSFLIGITLQTILLSWAIVDQKGGLVLALRASLFTGISILLFSAMSSVSNEFRYGTFEYTSLGSMGWARVLLWRSLATAVISWPAILGPFAAAAWVSQGEGFALMTAFAAGSFVLLWVICYWMCYLLNLAEQPAAFLPAFKYFLLIVGLNLVDVPWLEPVAKVTPTYWYMRMAQSDADVAVCLTGLSVTVVVWTLLIVWLIRPIVDRKMTSRWLAGRNT